MNIMILIFTVVQTVSTSGMSAIIKTAQMNGDDRSELRDYSEMTHPHPWSFIVFIDFNYGRNVISSGD